MTIAELKTAKPRKPKRSDFSFYRNKYAGAPLRVRGIHCIGAILPVANIDTDDHQEYVCHSYTGEHDCGWQCLSIGWKMTEYGGVCRGCLRAIAELTQADVDAIQAAWTKEELRLDPTCCD